MREKAWAFVYLSFAQSGKNSAPKRKSCAGAAPFLSFESGSVNARFNCHNPFLLPVSSAAFFAVRFCLIEVL